MLLSPILGLAQQQLSFPQQQHLVPGLQQQQSSNFSRPAPLIATPSPVLSRRTPNEISDSSDESGTSSLSSLGCRQLQSSPDIIGPSPPAVSHRFRPYNPGMRQNACRLVFPSPAKSPMSLRVVNPGAAARPPVSTPLRVVNRGPLRVVNPGLLRVVNPGAAARPPVTAPLRVVTAARPPVTATLRVVRPGAAARPPVTAPLRVVNPSAAARPRVTAPLRAVNLPATDQPDPSEDPATFGLSSNPNPLEGGSKQ
jgi:hypothetical protein